jgi:hypothetical protein
MEDLDVKVCQEAIKRIRVAGCGYCQTLASGP